ncbi:MAG: ABC transporter substrate-binding protein [Alphaproteobacteria bacterium]|nr:ABC transporter substrate-binding protein [Alphaproteobacteria bacterium]MBU0796920.1 ABC transporter substrate-binding protein [Alphaproteobacteria bacterium]MBU0886436.1 ABC transporter substrate-binding protein [Alphaproteobacteria bacterium]MBU1812341.1 ABC transporter substrate-binding protein [Alphaproteobacteria bacterium]MBU2090646.1 ABC transporter substrate-binding protein [Alphaproteobacteria bacterium]
MLKHLLATVAVVGMTIAGAAQAATEIVVQYPYGELFNETHKQIAAEFAKKNPDIKVTFRTAYDSYEEGTQKILREAVTNQLPDVTFQGLNRVRILVDRDIAVPMDDFIKAEKDFEKEGFHQAMFDIGTQNGKVYALPFAISLPITYWNLDLVKQAGGDVDNLPTTWDGVIALAKKIDALGPDINGITYVWDITGNWLWQAPVFAQGGTMLNEDESKVAFDGPAGQFAMKTLARFVTEANMPNLSQADARATFAAGKTGVHITSTSDLAKTTDMIGGKFNLKTHTFPDVKPGEGRLPAGGNVAMIVSGDKAKQKAAWEFVKFATGPLGASIMAKTTGYMPPNKVANDVYLKDFYVQNPNNYTAVKQLPILTKWYAFPGENGLKITDVIKDHMNSIITRSRSSEPQKVLDDMTRDVQKLLPKKAS